MVTLICVFQETRYINRWDWVEDWAIHLGVMLSMFGLGGHSFWTLCWYDGHGLGIGRLF